MARRCGLEVYLEGAWHLAAEVRVDDHAAGVAAPARLSYDFDYLDRFASHLGAHDLHAVSCRHPVGYEEMVLPAWPAFLLDIVPSGAARRWWEGRLGLPNVPRSDWELLVRGGGNPIGNVRVAEAARELSSVRHAGFPRDDVLVRGADFIEYAHQNGASVAGGSGAGGDAPKLLLREDDEGRFHADAALDDTQTRACWLVKFPRSSRDVDRRILEAEAGYHRVAARVGVRTGAPVTWERDVLFVPRFDRVVGGGGVARLGVESLYAIAGVSTFGASVPKETFARAVAAAVSDPERELRELLLRDVLDVALGNTDNHGRNSALLKHTDGRIELSPLYDFAPMVLDPQGIARVSRWRGEGAGLPDYAEVLDGLRDLGLPPGNAFLRETGARIAELPRLMREEGVPKEVVNIMETRIMRVATALERTR